MDHEELEVRPAHFGERVTAFVLDGLAFYGLFLASLRLADPDVPVLLNPRGQAFLVPWLGVFLAYHALAASRGIPTLGKALLGLRVVDQEGLGNLPLGRAFLRSLGYLPSSFFNLGYLWALFHPEGLAWHDLMARSRVVAVRERPQALVLLGAGASLALLIGTFLWQAFGAPRFYRMETVAYAKATLENLGRLEEIHRNRIGGYTEQVDRLVQLTPDPDLFYQGLVKVLDPKMGILIQVHPDGKAFALTAFARDLKRTRVTVVGPLKG